MTLKLKNLLQRNRIYRFVTHLFECVILSSHCRKGGNNINEKMVNFENVYSAAQNAENNYEQKLKIFFVRLKTELKYLTTDENEYPLLKSSPLPNPIPPQEYQMVSSPWMYMRHWGSIFKIPYMSSKHARERITCTIIWENSCIFEKVKNRYLEAQAYV